MEPKSHLEGRFTLPLHQVARRASRALLICLFFYWFFVCVSSQRNQDDPSEIFLKAYLSAQQGEKLEHENLFKAALAKFRFAGSLIEELKEIAFGLAVRDRRISRPQDRRGNPPSSGAHIEA